MKDLLNKLGVQLLAALVLLSSISWTLEEHYCMGRLVEVSLFAETHGCGMELDQMDPEPAEGEKPGCCDEQTIVHDVQEPFKSAQDQLNFTSPTLLAGSFQVYSPFILTTAESMAVPEYRPPPLPVKDIQLLHEVFLI